MSEAEPPPQGKAELREILTNSLRFWEWRRLFYNLVLAAVVLLEFARSWPWSKQTLQLNGVLTLFLLAVLANVAYCAVYLVEILVQFSDFREPWRRYRPALWLLGTLFALVLTHLFSQGMFQTLVPD